MKDAVVGGDFLLGQREEIGAEKVLPVVVVEGGVGEVDIGPNHKAFAFRVGGTLEPLKKFETENDWGLNLGIELVD